MLAPNYLNQSPLESKFKDARLRNRYWLMRHGESLANQRGVIVSKPSNAVHGYGLSERGREQAQIACKYVLPHFANSRVDQRVHIVSSDYARAKETALVAQQVLNTQSVLVDKRLRERDFGGYELKDHAAYSEIWEHDLAGVIDLKRGAQPTPLHDVESVESVLNRGLQVIDDLEAQFYDENIVLVGHGDVMQILLTYFSGQNPRLHRSIPSLGNAEIRALV